MYVSAMKLRWVLFPALVACGGSDRAPAAGPNDSRAAPARGIADKTLREEAKDGDGDGIPDEPAPTTPGMLATPAPPPPPPPPPPPAQPNVAWMPRSVKVRCSGFLAPVLSSHTCNRW